VPEFVTFRLNRAWGGGFLYQALVKTRQKGICHFFRFSYTPHVSAENAAIDSTKDGDPVFAFSQVSSESFSSPTSFFLSRDFCKPLPEGPRCTIAHLMRKWFRSCGLTGLLEGFCQFFIAGKQLIRED